MLLFLLLFKFLTVLLIMQFFKGQQLVMKKISWHISKSGWKFSNTILSFLIVSHCITPGTKRSHCKHSFDLLITSHPAHCERGFIHYFMGYCTIFSSNTSLWKPVNQYTSVVTYILSTFLHVLPPNLVWLYLLNRCVVKNDPINGRFCHTVAQ